MAQVLSALAEPLKDGTVKCNICERRCVVAKEKCGWCSTRANHGGKLYSTVFGEVSTKLVAPIEAKPVFHFFPGSKWLSLGTLGCNLHCGGCQNWEIAHEEPCNLSGKRTQFLEPKQVVAEAKQAGAKGISWTYNEPTMWLEYTARTNELAKREGLYTCYVTNGYMTRQALDLIGPNLDIFRVDIKGFSREYYAKYAKVSNFEPILENALRAKSKWDMHVEVVTNVVPGLNDNEAELGQLATWIATRLGKRTPWHVTRFLPYLELADVPCTPIETLDRAREIGFDVGLLYVYMGNVPGHPGENTYCPKCGRVVIGRHHFSVIAYNLTTEVGKGPDEEAVEHEPSGRRWTGRGSAGPGAPGPAKCKYCGQRITGVFE